MLRIPAREMQAFKETREALKLEGTLTYDDGFEDKTQQLCYYFFLYEFTNKIGMVKGSGGPGPFSCEESPGAIASILRTKKEQLAKD